MREGKLRNFEEYDEKCEWYDDPRNYEYVREGNAMSRSLKYMPIKKNELGKLIGREVVDKNKNGTYYFKFWYLKEYDRGMPDEHERYAPGELVPTEAVRFV